MKNILKKYIKLIVIGCIVVLFVVPLLSYGLSEVSVFPVTGKNDWAGFWGGYFGAIIGGICTVGGVFLSIRYEREKGKEDAERAVLPYIALTTLEQDYKVDYFHLKRIDDIEDGDDRIDGYREFLLDKIYFIIKGEEVEPRIRLTKEQRVLLENMGHYMKEEAKGVTAVKRQRLVSIPIMVTNVGNGAAINFRLGVHLGNKKYNDNGVKYTIAKHLEKGASFYLNLYFEDVSEYVDGKQFVLRIIYENIYAEEYIQEYPINIEKNGALELDLGHKQKKCG